ncbi:MAG: tryptophan 7-halogenase [Gemmatimonadetes bacterium]|nr:tryptophan 7-halogenase [Gemmatimonadota bacterium]
MKMKTDVAIVGGGPGGCVMAMYLLEQGITPLVIEKETFPRYHIGESMTGEAGNLLRSLGLEEILVRNAHPRKQGVNVIARNGNGWWVPVMKRNDDHQLEPAQTWQVRRSDFDRDMMAEAIRRGARWLPGRAAQVRRSADGTVTGLQVQGEDGSTVEVESEVLVDASGQYTWLAHQGVTSRKNPGRYDKQIAIFSQVRDTIRGEGWDGTDRARHPDNTYIFYAGQYHWAWFIPLDNDAVSVGVVSPSSYFASKGESREAFLRRELAELNPEMARRLKDLTLIEEARAIPNYSYHITEFTGKGWMCIGDTHRFIDPIFSFGLYVSMKEAQFAAPVIKRYLAGEGRDLPNPFLAHMQRMEGAIDHLQDLIDGFWGASTSFAYLVNNPRTRDQMIDLFAGRIYDVTPETHPAILELRALAEKARQSGALWGEDRRGSGFASPAVPATT